MACPDASSSDEQQPEVGRLHVILGNLAGLVLAGTLVSAWILFYTDWFPAIGGLLTLGGAFAWLAFLSHLVKEDRKKQIQDAFERSVLLRRWLWKGVAALVLLLLVVTAATGTVVVQSYRDETHRSVTIHRLGGDGTAGDPIEETALPGRSSRKFLLAGRGPFRVKLSGLPAITMRARPFFPKVLAVPDDFTRSPVVLLRPTLDLSRGAARTRGLTLTVRRGEEVLVASLPFRGRAVWIGCDADVAIPERIRSGWKPDEPAPWLPAVAPEKVAVLEPRDELTIELMNAFGTLYVPEIRHVVEPPHDSRDFVQEVEIDVPR